MTGSTDSPCGACKFLRRKCVKGCVFAPYFCHEESATHFAAIHKVFGASNASKLLAGLPNSERCEAAATISYEAQARLQDPIYGCVSHIFALQRQVMNLQAQLASLKEQAAQCMISSSNCTANPNRQDLIHGESQSFPHSFQNQVTMSHFENNTANMPYYSNGSMNFYPSAKYESSGFTEENTSFGSMDSLGMHENNRHWQFQDVEDDLQSVALRYIQLSHEDLN